MTDNQIAYIAQYMYINNVEFIEQCDAMEYKKEFVVIHSVNDERVNFTDHPSKFPKAVAFLVSDIVDNRVDILEELDSLINY